MLWNLLLFGVERLCGDVVTDAPGCHCYIDSTFWLLTKPEQCAELTHILLELLHCQTIVCVAPSPPRVPLRVRCVVCAFALCMLRVPRPRVRPPARG